MRHGERINGDKNGRNLRRYGRALQAGQPSRDPANNIQGAPPNLGRGLVPQIVTFIGRDSTWTNVYRNPDEAIRHSRENARMMRRDPAIMECLEARQRATALLNWHIEPEDQKDERQKELVNDLTAIVQATPQFTEYKRNLLEALWYGRYAVQHFYAKEFVRGIQRTVIKRWLPIHGDKLAFRFDDGSGKYPEDQIGVRVGTNYNPDDIIAGRRVYETTDWGMAYFLEPWERSLMCVHKHTIEDGEYEDPISAGRIHGVGIRDRIYWCWFQKQETLAHLMEVIERTGSGFTIYYYPAGNPSAKEEVEEMAKNQTKDNVLLIPRMSGDPALDAYGVERIEPSSQGIEALKGVIHEFFGHQIKRYILGQILSSESAATGLGSGVADLHQDTFYGIIEYDAVKLEETLTTDLLTPLKNWNFPWARNIRVRFKIDTKSNESEEKLQAAKQAWDMGARLKESDIMDLIGFSTPTEDDRVLQNPAMQQQQRLWEQSHPGAGDAAAGGAPEGSNEDMFGPLMGLLGQGGGPDETGDGPPPDGPDDGGDSPPPGHGVGPQKFAKRATAQQLMERYAKAVDDLAAAVADTDRNPSDEQREAGNYRKGKLTLHGLPVTIETPKGCRRRPEWPPVAHHYGYINSTEGRDTDQVDVFIGPRPDSEIVFVVDQVTEGGRFDEHKCMLGFTSEADAKAGYLANYTSGWKCGPITAMTVPQFRAWLESGDMTRRVAEQVSRYEKTPDSMPATAAEKTQHQVGETKNINGVTYRLNENHRWTRADGDDDLTPELDAIGSNQPAPDHEQRVSFVRSQLKSVDKTAGSIMRAMQAAPDFEKGAEYATQDFHPKQAGQLYSWLRQNAGKEAGGGKVVDFGQGRLGFASAAGSVVVWGAGENGKHKVAYTANTGVVSRAMEGGQGLPAGDSEAPPVAQSPESSAALVGNQRVNSEPEPPPMPQAEFDPRTQTTGDAGDSGPASTTTSTSDSGDLPDDRGDGQGPWLASEQGQQPEVAPAESPKQWPKGMQAGDARGEADKAKRDYEGTLKAWEKAVDSGADRKTISKLRQQAQAKRSLWKEHQKRASDHERQQQRSQKQAKPKMSPKVQEAMQKAAAALGITLGGMGAAQQAQAEPPLLAAAEQGKGGGAVPQASPEQIERRRQADAEKVKQKKLRDWENNVGLHLQEHGIQDTPEHRQMIQDEIAGGRISERSHLDTVLRTAKALHDRGVGKTGKVQESQTPSLKESLRRRINRAEQDRKSFDTIVRQKAKDWDIGESDLRQAAEDAWAEKRKFHESREAAKAWARKSLGVNRGTMERLANQNKDDTVDESGILAEQLAREYPELGWPNPDHEGSDNRFDYGGAMQDLLREGPAELPGPNDEEYWNEVGAFLDRFGGPSSGGGGSSDDGGFDDDFNPEDFRQDDDESIPFHRLGRRLRYRKYLAEQYAARKPLHSSPGQQPLFSRDTTTGQHSKWREELHPRDEGGQFASKGEGGVKSSPGQKKLDLLLDRVAGGPPEMQEAFGKLLADPEHSHAMAALLDVAPEQLGQKIKGRPWAVQKSLNLSDEEVEQHKAEIEQHRAELGGRDQVDSLAEKHGVGKYAMTPDVLREAVDKRLAFRTAQEGGSGGARVGRVTLSEPPSPELKTAITDQLHGHWVQESDTSFVVTANTNVAHAGSQRWINSLVSAGAELKKKEPAERTTVAAQEPAKPQSKHDELLASGHTHEGNRGDTGYYRTPDGKQILRVGPDGIGRFESHAANWDSLGKKVVLGDAGKAEQPAKPAAKEPWEVTRQDHVKANLFGLGAQRRGNVVILKAMHRKAVTEALAAGKPVPPEVLADYPELQKPDDEPPSEPGGDQPVDPTPAPDKPPQTDLLGQPLKAPAPPKQDFGSTSGKQNALFDTSGKRGQMNLMPDTAVPDELLPKEFRGKGGEKAEAEKPEKPKSDRKFMSAGEAAKAGKSYADWTGDAGQAFVNEEIDDDHPAWQAIQSGTAPHLDDYNSARDLYRQHVRTANGHHGQVTDVADDGRSVTVTHADGTTSKHGPSGLSHLGAQISHDAKRGRDVGKHLNYLAPKIAEEFVASGENIGEVMRRHGLDPVKDMQARKAISEAADKLREAAKPKPSEARKRAMERSLEVNAPADSDSITEEQAKSRKWTKNEDGTYTSPNGTVWKKAAAGGEVSPVNGKHFKGGHLMPIHGLSEKPAEKPPKGDGGASSDVSPNEDEEAKKREWKEPRAVRQMTPEQIEAERQRREEQKRWDKLHAGPLKEFMNLSDKPYAFAPSTRSDHWRKVAKDLGPEKTKQLVDLIKPMWAEDIQEELGDRERPKFGGVERSREEWLADVEEQLKQDVNYHGELLYPKNLRKANPHAHEAEMLMRSVKPKIERLEAINDAISKLRRSAGADTGADKPVPDNFETMPDDELSQRIKTARKTMKPGSDEWNAAKIPEVIAESNKRAAAKRQAAIQQAHATLAEAGIAEKPKEQPKPVEQATPESATEPALAETLDETPTPESIDQLPGESESQAFPDEQAEPEVLPEQPHETPREAAARETQRQIDEDYAFARKSDVRNAGEDLLGSARHKVNAWKSLQDAEENGTAEAMVTRANLFKNEPHNLVTHAARNPLTALAMFHALKSLPPEPGYGNARRRERIDAETKKTNRANYLDAYRELKAKAEEYAEKEVDPRKALLALGQDASQLIKRLRNKSYADDTANALVSMANDLRDQGRKKTSPMSKVNEFLRASVEKYGSASPAEHLDKLGAHAQDIMEGKSLPASFGKKSEAKERFDPTEAYVKHATRKGGRDVSKHTADPNVATKHLVDNFKFRGIQWGNYVTDDERKHHAARVVEAVADLADVTGLRPEDIALDGKLGMAIGARGHGGASAHYEPGTQVINITRASGVGTIAHEWGHAFDHMLNNFKNFQDGGAYMSKEAHYATHEIYKPDDPSAGTHSVSEDSRPYGDWKKREKADIGLRKAYGGLYEAQSKYRSRLRNVLNDKVRRGVMSERKANDYWASNHEIFARTFERYVQRELLNSDRDNTYLTGLAGTSIGENSLWPTDAEVAEMKPHFDKIFSEYRKKRFGSEDRQQYSKRGNGYLKQLADKIQRGG